MDSYDPARVIAGWANAELTVGPNGAGNLSRSCDTKRAQSARGTFRASSDIEGKGFTRFRARAMIDDKSRTSDISPAVRFFVFNEKPDPDRLDPR